MEFASQATYRPNKVLKTKWSIFTVANLVGGKYKGIELVKQMQEEGMLPTSCICCKCGSSMTLCQGTNYPDGCPWVCRKRNRKSGRICNAEASVRNKTWFANSRMSIPQMVLFYNLL